MQECGECTRCCDFLEIKDANSKPFELCQHCNDDDDDNGCKIYKDRPEGCKEFECMWLQVDGTPTELRPDMCGIVFEKFSDVLICGGMRGFMSERAKGQIMAFVEQGFSVVLMDNKNETKTVFPARGHSRESVEKELNGSS